ncbi:MAG: VOC family protein [Anaerovoracaceae bacterium]|nr:VOC family protein [Bacillota bacterium]MDY2671230.1 VOC family protein [Anaerovoracaceae bacterium]
MGLIKGMHHTALRCAGEEEMNRAISFYCDILGLTLVRRWGSGKDAGCMITTGDRLIEMFADAEPGRTYGIVDHLALDTDDVDGCIEAVRSHGFKVTDEPHDIVIPSEPPFPARIAFCEGAAGENIEFFQEK